MIRAKSSWIEVALMAGTDIMFKRYISTRFDCSVCIQLALQHLDTDKESYIPGLYIPSKWEPPLADANVEACLI
jgi:hypothetical protein